MQTNEIRPDLRSMSMVFRFKSHKMPQLLAAFAATLSAFGMGTVEAYTSPALPDMQGSPQLGSISEKEYSNVASFALLAALASGIPTGILLEKLGRKATIMLISIPFVTGWLMIAFAMNISMVHVGRILTGVEGILQARQISFCAGSASMAVPVFLGEVSHILTSPIAEDSFRGFLGSTFQFQVTAGNFFVYVLGKFLNWQWLALSCSIVILVGLVLMAVVPPSPRFLLSKGRFHDAARALVWLRGAETVAQIENELYTIKKSVESSNETRQEFRDFFTLPIIRPLNISLLLLFFQQMTGVEAILVYTVDIFEHSGSIFDPNTSVIIVGGLQVTATLLSALVVDKAGRRILLIISAIGSSLAMAVLGAWFYYIEKEDLLTSQNTPVPHAWVPLLTLGFFIVSFSLGLGPIPFIMIAELNNSKMIGIASACSTTFNWTFAFIITRYFLLLADSIGFHFLFWSFAGISVIGAIFVFIFVPETKGKSIDEIQKYFKAK